MGALFVLGRVVLLASSSAMRSNTYWLNDSAPLNIVSVLTACFIFHMLQVVEGGGVDWRQFRCAGGAVARQAGAGQGLAY